MLADRFKTTAVSLFAFAIIVLIRRQIDGFIVDPVILNFINVVTIAAMCFVIVMMARAWMPDTRNYDRLSNIYRVKTLNRAVVLFTNICLLIDQ